MQPEMQKSILQMARGAIMERADYEMSRLLANILDPNTSATAKRKLTLTLELKPDDDRQTITVSCIAKTTLAATNPVSLPCMWPTRTAWWRWCRRSPGQLGMDGNAQEAPPVLKIIKLA